MPRCIRGDSGRREDSILRGWCQRNASSRALVHSALDWSASRKGDLLFPVATFKQGELEVSVLKNQTKSSDLFNTTIRNSYKDDKSGE